MRKYALWFFRQMSAVRGRLLLRIIAGLLQVALGLWLVWLCRRFIDVVIWRGNVLRETIVLFSVIALLIALRQLVFYLSGITEVILQNDMRSRLSGLCWAGNSMPLSIKLRLVPENLLLICFPATSASVWSAISHQPLR